MASGHQEGRGGRDIEPMQWNQNQERLGLHDIGGAPGSR